MNHTQNTRKIGLFTLGIVLMTGMLSGCTAIKNWADGVGDKMPTSGTKCGNRFFCLGGEGDGTGAVYPPQNSYPGQKIQYQKGGQQPAPQPIPQPMPQPMMGQPLGQPGMTPPPPPPPPAPYSPQSSAPGSSAPGGAEPLKLNAQGYYVPEDMPIPLSPEYGAPVASAPAPVDPRAAQLKPWEANPEWEADAQNNPTPMDNIKQQIGY